MTRARILAVAVAGVIAAAATFSLGHAASLSVDSARIDSFAADQAAPTTTVQSDTTAPALTKLEMFDTNSNGKVDQVVATFSETLASYTAGVAPWTLASAPSGGTLTSVSVTGATATLTLSEGSNAPNTAVETFTVKLDTADTGIRDAVGNKSSFVPTAPADKAAPIVTHAEYFDANTNGKIDQIQVRYSESLATTTATAPWSVTGGPSGFETGDLAASTATTSGAVITLPFREGTGTATATTTVATTALTVFLDNATQQVKDLATPANFAASMSRVTTDKAAPIVTSLTNANSTSGGTIRRPNFGDTVTAVFSEPLSAPSVCPGTTIGTTTFSVANTNDVVQVHFTDNASADSFRVLLTTCASGGLRFGDVALNGNFVTATTEMWGNGDNRRGTIALTSTPTTGTITVQLGAVNSGAVTTAAAASIAVFNPHDSIADPSGNTVPSTFTLSTASVDQL